MPRSLQEILNNADALADAFEAMGEDDTEIEVLDGGPLRHVLAAVRARAQAEQAVLDAVVAARQAGFTWDMIGSYLGTSGEAARQRYGALIPSPEMPRQQSSDAPPGRAAKATPTKAAHATSDRTGAAKRAASKATTGKNEGTSTRTGRRSG